MDDINVLLQILVNIQILYIAILTIYKRFIFNKQAEAVRGFARFLDKGNPSVKMYDMEQQAKRNALDKIILSGMAYEENKK